MVDFEGDEEEEEEAEEMEEEREEEEEKEKEEEEEEKEEKVVKNEAPAASTAPTATSTATPALTDAATAATTTATADTAATTAPAVTAPAAVPAAVRVVGPWLSPPESEAAARVRLSLYFALCVKSRQMLSGLIEAYVTAAPTAQAGLMAELPLLAKAAAKAFGEPGVVGLMAAAPEGAKTLILMMLDLLVPRETNKPSPELVAAVRRLRDIRHARSVELAVAEAAAAAVVAAEEVAAAAAAGTVIEKDEVKVGRWVGG